MIRPDLKNANFNFGLGEGTKVLNTCANLFELKQSLAAIDQPQQRMAATIGLLASSGLNHTQQMPEMCHLVQHFFRLTSCGFFWSDQAGDMQDAWCISPQFLNFKTLTSCMEYQASGLRTWPTFQENVLMGPVAGYLLPFQNARFYASEHFQATYASIDVRHILDVVLHDGDRPFGALLLMRSAEQGPFRPDERSLLVKLIPLLTRAFSTSINTETSYSEKEKTGFALVGEDGKYISMNQEACRIVWMLAHVVPGSFALPNDPPIEQHLENLVTLHGGLRPAAQGRAINIDNRWGRFTIMFERESRSRKVIVTLSRRIPLHSQLAFWLAKLDLPPMRQLVAWMLAQDYSRAEIAAALGVSVETVTSHIKLIYKVLGTSSSHGLFLKLAS